MKNLLDTINKIGKDKIILMALAGAVLLFCSNVEEKDTSIKSTYEWNSEKETKDYENEIEKKLTHMLEKMEGTGECEVMITLKSSEADRGEFYTSKNVPQIEGVLVLTQGANNPDLTLKINSVIQALFDVDVHKISIVEMK